MILIVGGAFQGKRAYANNYLKKEIHWIDGKECEYDDIFSSEGIFNFHLFVKRILRTGEPDQFPEQLMRENPDIVIVTDELGYGVVPVEASDRAWREKTGRICTELAEQADEVHRVVCGVGMVIKNA
ncbi:bifunctional adenosylcobinamide kinase/adenosylcobinamide-phosphate guanylyltransferase [Blautia liquoris]|jgi:adenosylcobinamide kinase/adenosylcobinamide-phosphate guanylyltransferase|uniref:Adenosylcobinamide kinase n=1 Tax=Blautia liquoris TaxID=2779518 RepID=A0A7M2RJT4_9FIRM|nr:bifunctional adenosylcobinamide kinase/adenosylcobinamide-phosphate guanylyltransferase [Blautia liquoris]QOV20596.1 bifunctional adenosylcobinamide kinase/adenosylcobinamide-phosphate guanylyltransferase [Blautia liquoris]